MFIPVLFFLETDVAFSLYNHFSLYFTLYKFAEVPLITVRVGLNIQLKV